MRASNQQNGSKLDVNKDGVVSPLDALHIVNAISSRSVPVGEGEYSDPIGNAIYDTNGDGELSPLDVMLVVNWLQRAA